MQIYIDRKQMRLNIRSIWKTDLENGVKATHYHPKDIGGLIISIDSMNKKIGMIKILIGNGQVMIGN